MRRVSILVTHLLGSGHLSRALFLARSLSEKGFSPQLISGGLPLRHLDVSGLNFVQLPPVRSDSISFTRLLDDSGMPASPELMAERISTNEEAIGAFAPNILITELFPFGRRVLREEFLAAIKVAKRALPTVQVFSSVRDILAPPSNKNKAAQTDEWLTEHYRGVLVHSDPAIVALEESWPVTAATASLLHYTGFIAPRSSSSDDPSFTDDTGKNEVIVTAGGGPVGRKLFEVSVAAARMGNRQWRLLIGGNDAADVCARLNGTSDGAPVVAEPLRADYRTLLTRCSAAVGHCGYNTAVDWLQVGVAGVFVPFSEGGETEQSLRAASLEKRYGYGLVTEDDLTPENLFAAVEDAILRGVTKATDLNFDGGGRTVEILQTLTEIRK